MNKKFGEKASITILQIDLLLESRDRTIKQISGYLVADYRYSLYDKAIYDIEGVVKGNNSIYYIIGKRGFDTANRLLSFTLLRRHGEPMDIILRYDQVKNAYYGIKHMPSLPFKDYEYVKAKISLAKDKDPDEIIRKITDYISMDKNNSSTIKIIDKFDTPTINEYYHLYERSDEAKIYFKNLGIRGRK